MAPRKSRKLSAASHRLSVGRRDLRIIPPTISITWSFERHLGFHTGHLSRKFTQDEVERMIEQIEKWFAAHPRRQLCRNEFFTVRRNHTREDVTAHCVSYVENDAASESIRKSIKRHHKKTGETQKGIEPRLPRR